MNQDTAKIPHPQEPSNGGNSLRDTYCERPSAKSLLDNMVHIKQRELDSLRIVFNMLPTVLTSAQDEALFNVLSSIK